MAKLTNGFEFIGRLGDLTAYRMKGCKHIVLRRCGGPSARQIKNDPQFKTARLHATEFGARAKAISVFAKMLRPHKAVSDYNYSQAVGSHLKVLQGFDTINALGRRSILFSQYPEFWEGFSLNEKRSFDSMIYAPLQCTISRETLSARVEIPELMPNIHRSVPTSQGLFRIQAALGLLPDFVFREAANRHVPSVAKEHIAPATEATPWIPCRATSPAAVLELKLPAVPPVEGYALMVSVGICFGTPANLPDKVVQVENAGAAKMLAVK